MCIEDVPCQNHVWLEFDQQDLPLPAWQDGDRHGLGQGGDGVGVEPGAGLLFDFRHGVDARSVDATVSDGYSDQ